jgi:DNA repair exonuclease SbcCD ATPase subunit
MSSYIDIHLINFRYWIDHKIRIVEGINLIVGESGSGKSTWCKAIHFVLFGGKKHTDVTHYNHIKMRTEVSFHFVSPNLEYKIIRTRPSESLLIHYKDSKGIFEMRDTAAQCWINNHFGLEDCWMSSSYISLKKPHFLLNSSNADKMGLLQQISFGDVSPQNQPETHLNKIKIIMTTYNDIIKKLYEEIRIQESIKNNIIFRNPEMSNFGEIDKENLEKLIIEHSNENTKLAKLRTDFIQISSRRMLQIQLKSIPKYSDNLEDIDERLNNLKLAKIKKDLSNKLRNFNVDILNYDINKMKNDDYLFKRYIKAGWNSENDKIEDFINECRNNYNLYKMQQQLDKKNDSIRESNKNKEELNNCMLKTYRKQLSDHNKLLESIKSYDDKYEKMKIKLEEVNSEIYIQKMTERDDSTSIYLVSLISTYKMSLKELTCPNCKHGLIYSNGKLDIGTMEGSEENRKKYKEIISIAEIEYEKRKKRETIIREYEDFKKLERPLLIENPESPKLFEMEPLILIKDIKKPLIDSFEIPFYSIEEYTNLYSSIELINLYHEYSTMKIEILYDEEEYSSLKLKKNRIIEADTMIKQINLLMKPLIEDDPNIEEEMEKIIHNIDDLNKKIAAGQAFQELERVKKELKNLEDKQNSTVKILADLEEFYNYTHELGITALQEKIDEVNGSLKQIFDELFFDPINIKLTSHKHLKNGDVKLQVNFDIDYKGMSVSNMNGFSDGEESRISLALLMAFSRMNSNPIIMIDEVMATIDSELKKKCLSIINKWSAGKFVIHICHEIIKGLHYNVIDLNRKLEIEDEI